MANFEEKTTSSREIFSGKILRLRVDDVTLPDGAESKREIVEHPGAVAIVAVNSSRELLLVKQYRKPIEQVTLEIPAGLLEKGEEPKDCGARELEEETGYQANNLQHLTTCYTSPGFSNEKLAVFLATDLIKTEQNLDDDEFVEIETIPLAKALEMIKDGEIVDGKTILGITMSLQYLDKE